MSFQSCNIIMFRLLLFSQILWTVGFCISIHNCPDTLEQNKYLKAFGDKCYFFYLFISREYNGAQGVCRENGGNLVSMKSAKMNSYLLDQLKNDYEYDGPVWIGLSDQDDEGNYVWRDGSAMGYSNFESSTGPDTPWWDISNKGQDCVAMSPWSGEWEDAYCGDSILYNHHHAFVCEYDPKPKPPPTTATTSTTTTTTDVPTTTTTTVTPTTRNTPTTATTSTTTTDAPTTTTNTQTTATTTSTTNTTPTISTSHSPTKPTTTMSTPPSPASTQPHPPSTTTTLLTVPTNEPHEPTSVLPKETTTATPTQCPMCNLNCGSHGYTVDIVKGCVICTCLQD